MHRLAHAGSARGRQDHRKTGTLDTAVAAVPVLRANRAAVGLHDLPGDGEPQTGILAELVALRTVRIKALENAVDVLGANAGTIVIHNYDDPLRFAARCDAQPSLGPGERQRIVDQIVEYLAEAAVVSEHVEGVFPPAPVLERQPDLVLVGDPCLTGYRHHRLKQAGQIDRLRRLA